jgi:hypothetical protein
MRFMGRLPEGVKLGDFRYNVVRFDAVKEAGAAYESQSYDPQTGIQTHSMIYLPFAWYNLGKTDFVDGATETRRSSVSKNGRFHVRCERHLHFQTDTHGIMMETGKSASDAGRALLRSTLLHEVGHALGMQHNFRGSNAGNIAARQSENWAYSHSVMDYNTPALEDAMLFTSLKPNGEALDFTKGAKLGYDRQFIDILYNKAAQVVKNPSEFPVLPYCSDEDADDSVMGVDPTCIRYDFFAHPLEGIQFAAARIQNDADVLDASLGKFVSMKGMLNTVRERGVKAVAESSVEKLPQTLVAALSETLSVGKQFAYAGYISYRASVARYSSLLGEWKPLPENLTLHSEEAALMGWKALPIFDAENKASEELYVNYQRDVRQGILKALNDGLQGLRFQENSSVLKDAAQTVAVMDSLLQAAISRPELDSETKSMLQELGEKFVIQASGIPVQAGSRMLGDLAAVNWGGVVQSAAGANAIGRANVQSSVAKDVFDMLSSLVGADAETVAPQVRIAAASVLVKIAARDARWDTRQVRTLWNVRLRTLNSSLAAEFGKLDAALKKNGYLSATERERHESLAQIIAALKKAI